MRQHDVRDRCRCREHDAPCERNVALETAEDESCVWYPLGTDRYWHVTNCTCSSTTKSALLCDWLLSIPLVCGEFHRLWPVSHSAHVAAHKIDAVGHSQWCDCETLPLIQSHLTNVTKRRCMTVSWSQYVMTDDWSAFILRALKKPFWRP